MRRGADRERREGALEIAAVASGAFRLGGLPHEHLEIAGAGPAVVFVERQGDLLTIV
jgi:hypothetical protein